MTASTPGDDPLPELLEICEEFLADASPAVHHDLDVLLRSRGITGGPGWLIDMLALNRHRLQNHTSHDSRESHHRG
ncbi:hypothetical protein [Mangrovihabitans endophyticus]|uniref:Uncharacterized protein n=1 Tax=Mangrovihabitans endophyticus TaxID=1751298 RepID=A0A8J3C5D9_9ACTN|nr:hypothetical protein [Mangrovihabitans endophyticus]GGL11993.1 hypothetical protein GCM10012284_53430 [Mangrovihabitans endophyticus]